MFHGLTTTQANRLLKENGSNEIPEKQINLIRKIANKATSPIVLMLLLASGLSFSMGKLFDANFILILLILNVAITLWQESKADSAIKKLNENLAQKVKVFRDNTWQALDSRLVVVDDIVQLSLGEVIPADGVILDADHTAINESALTGESLPKDKKVDDLVYSGSFLVTGNAVIKVTATGKNTSFGKTIFSVERIIKKSLLEKDILSISKYLTILSLLAVILLTTTFLFQKVSYLEILALDLSLIIAGIPVSLPTVMTLITEFGILNLAKKKVIVRRLSALEDLANVDLLLTDKTGTLTENNIVVQDIYAYDGFTHNDVLTYAAIISSLNTENPIDKAILKKIETLDLKLPVYTKNNFIPADSDRKRSTAIVTSKGQVSVITLGAPQIVEKYCHLDKVTKEKFNREVATLANNGYRTLAVALKHKTSTEKNLQIVGLLALSDTLRSDAKSVVEFLKANGINVVMVTGDNRAIANQIAQQLLLDDGKVVTKETLDHLDWKEITRDFYIKTGAFAEILPEDKLKLVEQAKRFFIVASNGDGVNDLPALKAANVGIAVKSAVAALKGTADIVLISNGIEVIKDAIIESRKIFERIYTYSLYRISESLRLIVTIVVLGVLFRNYPLTALQIIIAALLNDIPIISLAFNRVKITSRPAKVNVKERFVLSTLYGFTGIANSLILFFLAKYVFKLDWVVIQTMYFLKLTVSGHLLIYVAHTKERWWKFLPSKEVILATSATQLVATLFAFTGFMMPGKISFPLIVFVWVWAFCWMQVGEFLKFVQQKYIK